MKINKKHPFVLLLFALFFVGLGCLGGMGMKFLLQSIGILETISGRLFQTAFFIFVIFLLYRFYLKKYENSLITGYNSYHWFRKVMLGIAIGFGLIVIQIIFYSLTGNYHVTDFQPSGEVIKYIFLMIIVGFLEELITRGIIFRLIERWAGSLIAIIVVAIEGGLIHATNPNATFWSSFAVALEFGVLMTLVYMATRNLWVVSALHFAWNFTMGGIFDIAVSGTNPSSLFKATLEGPAWLTGGKFGIEAGIPAIVVTIVSSIILISYIKKRDGFVAGPFSTK